jgi:hypothetical protein
MSNPTNREQPPFLPETRREEAALVPATRLEGPTTSVRGGMPRPFELPAVFAEQGFTYGERLTSRGGEASLHLVHDAQGHPFVLKIYHSGAPKPEVLQLIQSIGSRHVNPLYAYDNSEVGFGELQVWVREGSLRDLSQREGPQLASSLVEEVVQELGAALAEVRSKGHRASGSEAREHSHCWRAPPAFGFDRLRHRVRRRGLDAYGLSKPHHLLCAARGVQRHLPQGLLGLLAVGHHRHGAADRPASV